MNRNGKIALGFGIAAVATIGLLVHKAAAAPNFDLNHDGVLNQADVDLFMSIYGTSVNPLNPVSVQADFNKDGVIDIADWGLLSIAFGKNNNKAGVI